MLNRTGGFLDDQGQPDRAITYFQRALSCWTRVLGEDHPDTLASRNNLAHAYRSAGDLGRAIPLYERMLTDTERVLGDEHPITTAVRGNLAAAVAQRDGRPKPC
ncbi:tetratricopeptide repeat protein [Streptomyces griseofuscus]|uniref:tetratricopeptide repeat protein n=1 Tax=Streptomyces griseofuscus TaxID=146922 RepID=UPI0034234AE8